MLVAAFANVSAPAPDFLLKDINGESIKLSDYKGKTVFLNFWASWCPPCRQEMPSMQKLYEKMRAKKFEMLAVNIESGSKSSVVVEFIRKNKYTFKVLLDPDGRTAKKYGVISIPTTFIINKDGKIVNKVIGSRDWMVEFFNN